MPWATFFSQSTLSINSSDLSTASSDYTDYIIPDTFEKVSPSLAEEIKGASCSMIIMIYL